MTNEKEKNRKVVKCPLCNKVQVTTGERFFRCCSKLQPLKENLYYTQETAETTPSFQAETENLGGVNEFSSNTNSENKEVSSNSELKTPSHNQTENVLEIEEPEEEEEEEFKCPNCNSKVEPLTDCSNCGYILIWGEE